MLTTIESFLWLKQITRELCEKCSCQFQCEMRIKYTLFPLEVFVLGSRWYKVIVGIILFGIQFNNNWCQFFYTLPPIFHLRKSKIHFPAVFSLFLQLCRISSNKCVKVFTSENVSLHNNRYHFSIFDMWLPVNRTIWSITILGRLCDKQYGISTTESYARHLHMRR